MPSSPINTVADAINHPQVRARNMLVTVEDPAAGPCPIAGNPIKLSAYGDPATRPPMPDLDGDRARIVAELENEAYPAESKGK